MTFWKQGNIRLRTFISIQNNTIAYCTHTAKFLLIQFHIFTSDNVKILKIWHMRRIVLRPEVLLLTGKNFSMKQANLTEIFKKASKNVCSVHQPLWYLLTQCLILHQLLQLWRLQKIQKRTLMTVSQQMKEISKWSCTGQIVAVMKNYLQELGSV